MNPVVDLSGVQDYIPNIAAWLGIQPSSALLLVGLVVTAANLGGRVIPDTATGPLGVVRRICKLIGLFVPNRVAPNVSVNDVAKAVITRKTPDLAATVTSEVKEVLRDQIEERLDK